MIKCKRVNRNQHEYDISIIRPSKWGSPFSNKPYSAAKFKVNSRQESIDAHKEWLLNGDGQYLLDDIHELKGKTLGCVCKKNQTCHGDILVYLANNLDRKGLEVLF